MQICGRCDVVVVNVAVDVVAVSFVWSWAVLWEPLWYWCNVSIHYRITLLVCIDLDTYNDDSSDDSSSNNLLFYITKLVYIKRLKCKARQYFIVSLVNQNCNAIYHFLAHLNNLYYCCRNIFDENFVPT